MERICLEKTNYLRFSSGLSYSDYHEIFNQKTKVRGWKRIRRNNSLDGSFSHFKSLLRIHRGLTKARRYKVIREILRDIIP